ncbi:MAG: D-alanine--D-alanine ligase family protein [Gemmataceae bacterium]
MKIGLSFDLKTGDAPASGQSDDFQEEFDSPTTIDAIAAVLRAMGHDVVLLGDGREFVERVLAFPPDLVFNFAEGHGVSRSREARVPAVLEMLGIPYTGSDPLTLAATLDKDVGRRLVASHGGTVPRGFVVPPDMPASALRGMPPLSGPHIVKPAWEGSSKGIRGKCVVDTPDELAAAVEERRDQGQPLLVEEFIAGDELTVGVVGNAAPRVIGVLRVVPLRHEPRFVYSLEVKRDYEARVRYESPPPGSLPAVEEAALLAYRALGCRDVARIDFRVRGGVPYFLEANPLPGLNPETSDLVILARLNGMDHGALIRTIVEEAVARLKQ